MSKILPDYIAEAWIVEGRNDFAIWNEGLDRSIKQEVARLNECYIPRSFKPAHIDASDLEAASETVPFDRENWSDTLLKGPVVTFISRGRPMLVRTGEGEKFREQNFARAAPQVPGTLARRRNLRQTN